MLEMPKNISSTTYPFRSSTIRVWPRAPIRLSHLRSSIEAEGQFEETSARTSSGAVFEQGNGTHKG